MSINAQKPVYVLEVYQLDVVNQNLTRIDQITTFKNLTYSINLNGVGGAHFSVSVFDSKATINNLIRFRNVIAIKRNDTIIWCGPITDINILYQDVSGDITITCNDWLYYLGSRYTAALVSYPSQDISQIAWNLISTSQALDYGYLAITQGNTPVGISLPYVYEFKKISDAITDMSNTVGGNDFQFLPVLDGYNRLSGVTFNTYPSRLLTTRYDLPPLTVGINVKKINLVTFRDVINAETATGAGTGENMPTSFQEYGGSCIGYTRREAIVSLKDVSLASTLSAYNTANLNTVSVESLRADCDIYHHMHPKYGEFNLGDIVFLTCHIGNPNGYMYFDKRPSRVSQINVTVDDQGAETLTPRLDVTS